MSHNPFLFLILFVVAILLFAKSCYDRFRLLGLGKPDNRLDRLKDRFVKMFEYAFAQKRVVQRRFGYNHFIIFWAFMVLLIANGEFLLNGIFPAFTLSVLPGPIYYPLLLISEVVSLAALIAVCVAGARRLYFPPDYLDTEYVKAKSNEAFLILGFIGLLMIAYFMLHAAEIALGVKSGGAFMPVSLALSAPLSALSTGAIEAVASLSWWVHALVLLVFMNVLPRSKHMHILTAVPNCFFASLEKPNTQPREEFEVGNVFGVSEVERFTWKDLLDSYSCTECGRCQDVCPAHRTDKALNPRDIIHNIKANLLANGKSLLAGEKGAMPLINTHGEGHCTEEEIWDCTTCGACLEACPVLIEHPQKIVQMRRHLVQMEAKFPEELLNLFENMEQRSNPWGLAPAERGKWTSLLDVKEFDAEETEYLFYVGCAGSYDTRNKQVTVALAQILNAAGISWGTLGHDELCCGESVRRLGNEYVFEKMANANADRLETRGVKKIITQCPHCFSTLKNDYRQFDLELEVIHHTQFIDQLLKSGKLKLDQTVDLGKLLFHDPCYLGRHNDVYDAPRDVIKTATGNDPGNFTRNSSDSFCCGAGGGRMWMEELTGERINLTRVREGLEQKPDTICVGCPYCMTMMEDGLKDEGADEVRVRDVAEVISEAMQK